MPIRMSGLVSGLDTDTIVTGLCSGYQVKIDKVSKKKKKLEWQMEEWSSLNSKIYSFYTGSLSKLKTYGNYSANKATVSGTGNNMKVTAGSKAIPGSYKVNIASVASSAYYTGDKVTTKYTATYNATNATTFNEMYVDGDSLQGKLTGKSIRIDYNLQDGSTELKTLHKKGSTVAEPITLYDADGKEKEQTYVATQEQIDTYLSKLKENLGDKYHEDDYEVVAGKGTFTYTFSESSSVADLNAELKKQGIVGISAQIQDGKISFVNTAYKLNEDGSQANQLGHYTVSSADGALEAMGFDSNSLDVSVKVTEKPKKNDTDKTTYQLENTASSAKTAIYKVPDTALSSKSKMSDFFSDAFADRSEIQFKLTVGGEEKVITMNKNDTLSGFASRVEKESGNKITMRYDEGNQRFFLNAASSGADGSFQLEGVDDAAKTAMNTLGLGTGGAIASQGGQDTVIKFNGTEFRSSSNIIKLDALGLSLDVQNVPEDGKDLTVTVSKDTDGVYNMIKGFVKEYNDLVKTMSDYYYAAATSYEPLTDEEEEKMSDTQVEKWEKKAKSALLRRDSTLNTLMMTMRNKLSAGVSVKNTAGETKSYVMASFGVCTGSWNEYGKLHIEGDADDAEYSSKENKLKKAIEEDPDAVMNTFAQLGQNLYDDLKNRMGHSSLHSYQKLYNDKSMQKQIDSYKEEIEKMQTKMENMQDRYYNQFSKMESALSKLNSTSSAMGFTNSNS